MDILSFFGLVILALMFLGMRWGYKSEKKLWNDGICKETGEPWVSFDVDSQGGRGYKSGGHTIWISYPSVDADYNHFEREVLSDL